MAAADGHVTRSEWVRGIVMMAVSALRQPIMALVPFMAFTHIVKVLSLAAEIALTVDSAALRSIVGSASARELSPENVDLGLLLVPQHKYSHAGSSCRSFAGLRLSQAAGWPSGLCS